jgi:ParB/RepB/Spo0J family partition protein
MRAADVLKQVKISDILIGDRFRVDLGSIEDLTESVKEKGIIQPITLDAGLHLLAGGRRIAAAVKAGLTKIPALIREVEGEIDAREIELIENSFRKDFTWAEQAKLVAEIDRLCRAKDIEWSGRKTAMLMNRTAMDVSRALRLADALELIPEMEDIKTQDQAIKFVKQLEERAVTTEMRKRQEKDIHKSELTFLQRAKTNYNIGDAFVEMASLRTDGRVDFIEVDPPYGIDLNAQKRTDGPDKVDSYKEIPSAEYPQFLEKIARETFRVADRNSFMIFWFGPTHFTAVKHALVSAGWEVADIPGVWTKATGQTMQPNYNLANCYEMFFYCRKGLPALHKPGRSNVFAFATESPSHKYHPTQRPLDLMMELLDTFVNPFAIVLCPFLGSGVTLRAAYMHGMKAFGYDLNGEYKDRFLLAVEEDMRRLDADAAEEPQ